MLSTSYLGWSLKPSNSCLWLLRPSQSRTWGSYQRLWQRQHKKAIGFYLMGCIWCSVMCQRSWNSWKPCSSSMRTKKKRGRKISDGREHELNHKKIKLQASQRKRLSKILTKQRSKKLQLRVRRLMRKKSTWRGHGLKTSKFTQILGYGYRLRLWMHYRSPLCKNALKLSSSQWKVLDKIWARSSALNQTQCLRILKSDTLLLLTSTRSSSLWSVSTMPSWIRGRGLDPLAGIKSMNLARLTARSPSVRPFPSSKNLTRWNSWNTSNNSKRPVSKVLNTETVQQLCYLRLKYQLKRWIEEREVRLTRFQKFWAYSNTSSAPSIMEDRFQMNKIYW